MSQLTAADFAGRRARAAGQARRALPGGEAVRPALNPGRGTLARRIGPAECHDGPLIEPVAQEPGVKRILRPGARGAGPCDRAGRQSPNMMMELRNVWHYNPPLTCPYQ